MTITKKLQNEIENDLYISVNFEKKRIKIKGKPVDVFESDPLSILRLMRYCIQLIPMCTIEPDIFYSIKDYKYNLVNVSTDKIVEELNKILVKDKYAYKLAWYIDSLGLKDVFEKKGIRFVAKIEK